MAVDAQVVGDWESPVMFTRPLPAVLPFNLDWLPSSISGWIKDMAERMQCPVDYFVVVFLVELGAIVGRRIQIRPKRHDDWTVCANNYGLVVAPSGFLKTPALQQAMKSIRRLEKNARDKHKVALAAWQAEQLVNEAKVKSLKKQIGECATTYPEKAERIAAEIVDLEKPEPKERRYMTNDATVEKVAMLLNVEGNNGLLIFRDEIIGLLAGFEKDGHEMERAFYLEGWTGNGEPYRQDRVTREELFIENGITLSVLGGGTPSGVQLYLRQALDGTQDDGLMQRFQCGVYPDQPKEWKNVDRWPDTNEKNRACQVFDTIDTWAPQQFGCTQFDDRGNHILRFEPEAQEVFNQYLSNLENWLLKDGAHPALRSHIGKYRSFMPSVALLLHLSDIVDGKAEPGPVTEDAARRSVEIMRYFRSHAVRIYDSLISKTEVAAQTLAAKIKAKKIASPFTVRDVYKNEWIGLANKVEAERAIELLEDRHWVRRTVSQPTSDGGRSTEKFLINPKLFEES